MTKKRISRRAVLGGAASAMAFYAVPRHVLGGPGKTAPSDKLSVACIGVGGKGSSDSAGMASENVLALCDADARQMGGARKRYPQAQLFHDYREMLTKIGDKLDVVTVSTPDHHHAPASMMALKLGKHVFCQKPLTHSVYEARMLAAEAKKQKVATIMGIQGHCSESTRLLVEYLRAGVIGTVKEVHYWTNRPIWPQGLDRPKDTPPVPEGLNWDVWLGPAPQRPFHPAYLPFKWRGWWDFGTGALGDIACHAMAAVFWALDVGFPNEIEAETSPVNSETFPKWSIITSRFPARGEGDQKRPPLKIIWYDGGKKPPRPAELEPGRKMGDNGNLIIGTDGVMFNGRVIPETKMKEVLKSPPAKTLARSPGIYAEFLRACKGGEKTVADFQFSGHMTEVVLAGNLAIAAGKKVLWDGPKMCCTNLPDANKLVRREYRKGWTL